MCMKGMERKREDIWTKVFVTHFNFYLALLSIVYINMKNLQIYNIIGIFSY